MVSGLLFSIYLLLSNISYKVVLARHSQSGIAYTPCSHVIEWGTICEQNSKVALLVPCNDQTLRTRI